jgi:radical SAM protein with 4Fe4S-binding SPASM domain
VSVLIPPLPREAQLEVTGACNLRCRMCLVRYRPPLGRATASLPFERFAAIVDALPGLERLTLQGLGEPLLAPDLVRMVAYAAARGVDVGFNTNATLLTRRMAERLVDAGLGWLHVSLDGASPGTYEGIRDGARFDRLARRVRGLGEVVRARGGERPVLGLVFVAMRRNVAELPDVVRLAAAWGIPAVRVQNLSHSFTDAGGDAAYAGIATFTGAEALWADDADPAGRAAAAAAFDRARDVARELGVTLRLPALEERHRPRRPGTPGCDWPWTSVYVRRDGKVQPCCMLMGEDRGILGDVAGGIDAVWRSPAYQRFRQELLGDKAPEVCAGCAMYRGVF